MTRRSMLLLPSAVALLTSCTTQGSFPSLEPRSVERQYGALPPATGSCAAARQAGCDIASAEAPPAPPADDPALRARVADLVDAAQLGDADFAKRMPVAAERIAHAGATGSDTWIGAQQELSRLEAARSKTLDAAAELDALAIERARVETSAADLDAISSAATEAHQLSDKQQVELERLRALLSQD